MSDLLVFEYSGTPRSGKGTIVAEAEKVLEDAAREETGLDYRSLTKALLVDGSIHPEMPDEEVVASVVKVDDDDLTEFVAARRSIIDTYTEDALYNSDVEQLVSVISPIGAVRKAVKAGFRRRVEAIVNEGESRILLVDGRNLDKVIGDIANTRLVMRTFVSCFSIEAARREAARKGISTGNPDQVTHGHVIQLLRLKVNLEKRTREDEERELDPVKAEPDAIDYWFDTDVFNETLERYKNTHDQIEAYESIIRLITTRHGEYYDYPRHGAGKKAVETGRQINFDTTHFNHQAEPKQAMLDAALTMINEALEVVRT